MESLEVISHMTRRGTVVYTGATVDCHELSPPGGQMFLTRLAEGGDNSNVLYNFPPIGSLATKAREPCATLLLPLKQNIASNKPRSSKQRLVVALPYPLFFYVVY